MAKPPKKPKDPAHPTRAKAARPVEPATPDALADLLNPAINKGTAGLGSGTETGLAAAAGQFVRPARRFFRRPQGAQVDAQISEESDSRSAAARLSRARRSPGSIRQLAKELGLGDDEPPAPPMPTKDDPKYRLPRADLPQPGSGLSSMGVAATAQSLEDIAARGPPGIRRHTVDAAPPAAPGKIRRRQAARDRNPSSSRRATSPRRSANWSRASSATTARRCCSASPARARPSPWPR